MRRVPAAQLQIPSINLADMPMPARKRSIPYGWRLVDTHFEHHPIEWPIVETILGLHNNHHLAPAIRAELQAIGARTRQGEFFADWHVRKIIRLYGGERSARGARPGQHRNPAYGTRRRAVGEGTERDPNEWPVVEIILELHRRGLANPEIARHLVELGIKTRRGRDFTGGIVRQIVQRWATNAKKTKPKKAA